MDNTTGCISRRDREREQHRIDILDAAELIFVRDGISAKIETIAQEAEYSVGSIYNFFPSKDDLFKNVLLRISQLRVDSIMSAFDELAAEPWEGLRKICRFWLEHHLQHGNFLDVARSQWSRPQGGWLPPDDPIEVKIMQNVDKYREAMVDFFKVLLLSDKSRKLDANVMFVAYEGYIRTSFFASFRHGVGKFDPVKFENDVYGALCELFTK